MNRQDKSNFWALDVIEDYCMRKNLNPARQSESDLWVFRPMNETARGPMAIHWFRQRDAEGLWIDAYVQEAIRTETGLGKLDVPSGRCVTLIVVFSTVASPSDHFRRRVRWQHRPRGIEHWL